jgi:hypothetical protein
MLDSRLRLKATLDLLQALLCYVGCVGVSHELLCTDRLHRAILPKIISNPRMSPVLTTKARYGYSSTRGLGTRALAFSGYNRVRSLRRSLGYTKTSPPFQMYSARMLFYRIVSNRRGMYDPKRCVLGTHLYDNVRTRGHMYLNMLFLTLLFIAAGFPSSYSIPAAPPSSSCPCSFANTSASSSAWVFFLGLGSSDGLTVEFWASSLAALEEAEFVSE